MPDNENTPHPYDYSENLQDGRQDLQSNAQLFLDTLFTGCSILDFGAGLGQSKARFRHNKVFTYDIDARLRPFVDQAGGECPPGPWDVVASFDVIEHVQDDKWFIDAVARRAARAIFITTPNWYVSCCKSTHHWREYTTEELIELAKTQWKDPATLRLFGFFKDRWGGWWDMIPPDRWKTHSAIKHGLLVLHREEDRVRINAMHAGRFESIVQPRERWVPKLGGDDSIPNDIPLIIDPEGWEKRL